MPLYDETQRKRLDVKPGITGWAQINGRNAISWDEKFALDVWYVEHFSLGLDLGILALTIRKILRREGVSAPGEATMPRFLGKPPTPRPLGEFEGPGTIEAMETQMETQMEDDTCPNDG